MNDNPRWIGAASESRLDRAIDRAVRDLMHVDPRPGFRRRVLARLGPEPARSTLFLRFAIAAGVLAVLVLAVTMVVPNRHPELPADVARQETPTGQSAPRVTAGTPAATSTAATSSTADAHRTRSGARHVRRGSSEPIPMPRIANVFGERRGAVAAAGVETDAVWPSPVSAPQENRVDTIAPLVIPPIEPPAPIVIPPLNPRGPGI